VVSKVCQYLKLSHYRKFAQNYAGIIRQGLRKSGKGEWGRVGESDEENTERERVRE